MKNLPSSEQQLSPVADLRKFLATKNKTYGTIMADPPWQFVNRTGKMAPEHKRLSRYLVCPLRSDPP